MPCHCPDDRPPAPVAGCNYLVYSGGPLAGFYRLIEQAIPDVEMAHGRPTVHADGSLEFAGAPPAIVGYRQEGSRLCPAWPPCTLRMLKIHVTGGLLNIVGICGDPKSERFCLEIEGNQCQICDARQIPGHPF